MNLTFLRRKALGAGSIKGMVAHMTDQEPEKVGVIQYGLDGVSVIRNDKVFGPEAVKMLADTDWLVRWGCTSVSGVPLNRQINTSEAIVTVSNKRSFRYKIHVNNPELSPPTIFGLDDMNEWDWVHGQKMVVRPSHHAQGRNLWVVDSYEELKRLVNSKGVLQKGFYASNLIEKVKEYRVYVISGRIVTIANKIPDNVNDVAWNVAQGGKFEVVKWGDWETNVCEVAIAAYKLSGLDFGGVDIMVDKDGRAYMIEINSAPSLPIMVEGKVSYRQQCMAKGIEYMCNHDKAQYEIDQNKDGWRRYIHPSIWAKAQV